MYDFFSIAQKIAIDYHIIDVTCNGRPCSSRAQAKIHDSF